MKTSAKPAEPGHRIRTDASIIVSGCLVVSRRIRLDSTLLERDLARECAGILEEPNSHARRCGKFVTENRIHAPRICGDFAGGGLCFGGRTRWGANHHYGLRRPGRR